MQLGVFIPIGNNGWLISTTSPQYLPSFDLNRTIVEKAERFGFDFALSMIKLHGFGGPSQFWDHNLESFTLMAGLAAVTTRIQLFATCAVLTMPPPIAARMAVTIDSISHGRFGESMSRVTRITPFVWWRTYVISASGRCSLTLSAATNASSASNRFGRIKRAGQKKTPVGSKGHYL